MELDDVGDPPCVGCVHRARCAAQELACDQFAVWANTGEMRRSARVPTHELFAELFDPNGGDFREVDPSAVQRRNAALVDTVLARLQPLQGPMEFRDVAKAADVAYYRLNDLRVASPAIAAEIARLVPPKPRKVRSRYDVPALIAAVQRAPTMTLRGELATLLGIGHTAFAHLMATYPEFAAACRTKLPTRRMRPEAVRLFRTLRESPAGTTLAGLSLAAAVSVKTICLHARRDSTLRDALVARLGPLPALQPPAARPRRAAAVTADMVRQRLHTAPQGLSAAGLAKHLGIQPGSLHAHRQKHADIAGRVAELVVSRGAHSLAVHESSPVRQDDGKLAPPSPASM